MEYPFTVSSLSVAARLPSRLQIKATSSNGKMGHDGARWGTTGQVASYGDPGSTLVGCKEHEMACRL